MLKYRFFRASLLGLDYVFPPQCLGCGKNGEHWCAECQMKIVQIRDPHCKICANEIDKPGNCKQCNTGRPYYDAARALSYDEGEIAKAIVALKYREDSALGVIFASQFAKIVEHQSWMLDAIVPLPLAKRRMLERGYNQVEIFSQALALFLDIPHCPMWLMRYRVTLSQVGLSIIERKENMKNAFRAEKEIVSGKRILLMDDVMTTGSSLNSAAMALKDAGARSVYGLTLARANHILDHEQ